MDRQSFVRTRGGTGPVAYSTEYYPPEQIFKPQAVPMQTSVQPSVQSEVKPKKERDCSFYNITDYDKKIILMKLSGCPVDATSYTFWQSKANEEDWGFTVKCIPFKGKTFTWKLSWVYSKGEKPVDDCLKPTVGSTGIAKPICGDSYDAMLNIFNTYKN